MMIEFDANGIYENVYGEKTFKRIATFHWYGKIAKGGVYIGQSTSDLYLIELYTLNRRGEIDGVVEENWQATGELIQVPICEIIRIDEPQLPRFQ